ncbi:MAG: IS66 family insertion sequence element accessory protein TnpA [Rhodoferax sp.]
MEPIPTFLEVARRRPSAPLIRHGKEFWQQAVRDQETSGLSLSQFCLERGLAKATFFQWRKALKQQAQNGLLASRPETQSLPGFLAVPLGPTHTSTATQSQQVSARSDAEHHCNDAKIAIKLGGVDVVLSGHYADRVMRIITERLSSGGFR